MSDIAELLEPPRTRAWSYYVALFCAVLPLWSAVPLSWAFVTYSLYSGRIWAYGYPGRICFLLGLCELVFSIYHYQLAKQVAVLAPNEPAALHEIQAALLRLLKTGLAQLPEGGSDYEPLFLARPGSPEEDIIQLEWDDPRAVDFRNCLRTWFCKVPWSSIKLRDIQEWLYWSLYNARMPSYEELPESHRISLDNALGLLQKRLGCTFEDGQNPAVRAMRLTIDPIQIMWRPFLFYAAVKSVNLFLRTHYGKKWDVRYGSHEGLEYLLRIPTGWGDSSSPRPLVFIHGLGLGLLQYHILLTHMFEAISDRPILVLLQPHISQDFFHPHFLKPLDRHQMADKLASLLKALGWTHGEYPDNDFENEEEKEVAKALVEKKRGITLLSHSNGSYTHAWILKGHPHLVARSCFVDPVTFCSWEGDVCYNFFYRTPATGIELLMKYFVGTELGVANLLQRQFDWVANSLWFEEIPNACDPLKTLFLLGGKDDIVHAERVRRYLRSHGVSKNLWYDPEAKHGQALMAGGAGHAEILRWLRESEHN